MTLRRHFTPRNLPRTLALAAGAYLGAVLLGAAVGASIVLRSQTRWVKGAVVVLGRQGNTVWLPALPETLHAGPVGAVPLPRAGSSHLLLGPCLRHGALVERSIVRERGAVPSGSLVWVSSFVYNGTPAQLGLEHQETWVSSPAGELPAWHLPPPPHSPRGDALVVVIHGHGGQRAQGLRALPALRAAGVGALYVTFRNAFGAPREGKGYLSLGEREAEDAHAALRWAREHGYRRAVLFGFSMGGNIALSALRTPPPLPVCGVILDGPALEWRGIVRAQARRLGLPAPVARHVARGVERLTRRLGGLDFDSVDQLAAAERLSVPVLLFHGSGDKTVPVSQADAFASARPDLVEYHRVPGARHIRTWNADPHAYETAVRAFLERTLQGEP